MPLLVSKHPPPICLRISSHVGRALFADTDATATLFTRVRSPTPCSRTLRSPQLRPTRPGAQDVDEMLVVFFRFSVFSTTQKWRQRNFLQFLWKINVFESCRPVPARPGPCYPHPGLDCAAAPPRPQHFPALRDPQPSPAYADCVRLPARAHARTNTNTPHGISRTDTQ